MKTNDHTPTPWHTAQIFSQKGKSKGYYINTVDQEAESWGLDSKGKEYRAPVRICDCTGTNAIKDSAFIVLAVNHFDTMRKLLTRCLNESARVHPDLNQAIYEVLAAIEKEEK